jgi:uncharacterized protein
LVATCVATLALIFMEYASERSLLRALYTLAPQLYAPRFAALIELAAWVLVRIIGFALLPMLAIRLLLRRPILDCGLRLGTLTGHRRAYLVLFALVLPCIAFAASQPAFVAYYPFYKLADRSWFDLLSWELLYALHFVALEFFFRGFWPSAFERSMGEHAAYVSVAPYCMIHFSKPLLEVVAALPAGIVLGVLAMRARSIWGGALLHVAVAWSMDALALIQTTGWPERLWP